MEKRGVIADGLTPRPGAPDRRKLIGDDERAKQAEVRKLSNLDRYEHDLPRRAADRVAHPDK